MTVWKNQHIIYYFGPSKESAKDAEIRRRMEYLEVQPMDLSTVFGLVLGFVALFVGMAMKGVTPDSLFNVAAILIIIVGTACSCRHCISNE